MTQEHENQRKYLGVKFECCGVYARVYYDARQDAYLGRCPRCLKMLRILVDKQNGTSSRFFVAK